MMIISGRVLNKIAKLGYSKIVNWAFEHNVIGLVGGLSESKELGGWINTSHLHGYHYNENDGQWYKTPPPGPGYPPYAWRDPASKEMQDYLSGLKEGLDKVAEIEHLQPPNEKSPLEKLFDLLDDLNKNFQPDDNNIIDHLAKQLDDFFDWLSLALNATDPLVLDIDGDGIQTLAPSDSSAYFAFDGSDRRVHTGWISAGDGFLVLDRNGNGIIDSAAELFGNLTPLKNGKLAANGFDALNDYDTNRDGVIDSRDAIWSSLRIWRDGNGDGVTDQGELLTLEALGIVEIRLNKEAAIRTLENGNVVRGAATFVQIVDGQRVERAMWEIWFNQDSLHQTFAEQIPLRDDVVAMPFLQGMGAVRDLWQAASMDTAAGEALWDVLHQIANAKTTVEQHALIEDLLRAWAATSELSSTRSRVLTGQAHVAGLIADPEWLGRLDILEKFGGASLATASNGLVIVSGNRSTYIERAWDTLVASVYKLVACQTIWSPYLDGITYEWDGSGVVRLDFSGMVSRLSASETLVGADETARLLVELTQTFHQRWWAEGFDIAELLRNFAEAHPSGPTADVLHALGVFTGSGSLTGTSAGDIIFGQEGNDTLRGGDGDDYLDGGAGDDQLSGGRGSDTYRFGRRSGNDTIEEAHDPGGNDTDVVLFDADIRPEDVTVRRDGTTSDLLLTIAGSGNALRVKNQFLQSSGIVSFQYGVEQFKFADGTIWNKADVAAMALKGTLGNDILVGYNSDDLLDGGAGNDTLKGGAGSDTYLFGRQSGNDTIEEAPDPGGNDTDVVLFDADIRPEDITVRRDGTTSDLLLTISGSGNTLRVKNQFLQSAGIASFDYGVEQFKFADGTVWNKSDVAVMALKGTSGNDILVGYNGDDALDGGAGNDTLKGGAGSDTYLFGRESGNDTIEEAHDPNSKDTDVVQFDADIRPDDVTVRRDGVTSDLLLTVAGSGNTLRVKNQLLQSSDRDVYAYGIEEFRFADGTVWNKAAIVAMTAPLKSVRLFAEPVDAASSITSASIDQKVDVLFESMACFQVEPMGESSCQQPDMRPLSSALAVNV